MATTTHGTSFAIAFGTHTVKRLSFPDQHYLNSALGWLELGNPEEARLEAERISSQGRTHRDAFLVQWRIASHENCWTDAHRLALAFTQVCPKQAMGWICLSYSLYRLHRPLEAWMQLLPKASEFPTVSTIPYILGCYASEFGNQELSRRFLRQSAALGGPDEASIPALEITELETISVQDAHPNLLLPSGRQFDRLGLG